MENELFDYVSFDVLEDGMWAYYEVTTHIQIGEFLPGTYFDQAVLDFGNCVLFLENFTQGPSYKYNLSLKVGDLVIPKEPS